MAWGKDEQWLWDLAEEEGRAPEALLAKPEVPDHLLFVWGAFWDLSGDRHLGFGSVGPILFTSLDAYARRFRVEDGEEFSRFASLIRRMDGEWLEDQRKRAETKEPPPR